MQARQSLPWKNNSPPSESEINNEINRLSKQKSLELDNQINNLNNSLSLVNKDTANKYSNYLTNLGRTKQELLSQYDPTRLSKIQALQQLAGTTQFNPLLQTRLA